jgi:peptide/nickel transport system substrate-binding protein
VPHKQAFTGNLTRRALVGGLMLPALGRHTMAADAAPVRIALATETSSLDPMFHNVTPNNNLSRQIFDTLVTTDTQLRLRPGLALSWAPLGDEGWEFKLRPNVRFHDGTPFTAEDVAFSVKRVGEVPNSPSSFAMYLTGVGRAQVVDPLTVRLLTDGPAPLVPFNLPFVYIVSRRVAEGRTTDDFNSGAAVIGTGAYRFGEWVRGDRIVLNANQEYWGGVPACAKVVLRPVSNGAARVAALLSGDAELIEGVPGADLARVRSDRRVQLAATEVAVTVYMHLDGVRDKSPGITTAAGAPMDRNPLKDLRVRRAMTLAINREALTERLLDGQAKPAGQFMAEGAPGASRNLPPPAFRPDEARKLLSEAGYPDGFGIVLAASNDRYPRDAEVAQALAQMLGRVGIKVTVEVMPSNILFTRGSRREFSLLMAGWVSATGEPTSALNALLATYDPASGRGTSNRGRYSNMEFDRLLKEAGRTIDEGRRNDLLARAAETGIGDVGVIPLYSLVRSWGVRRGWSYSPRRDDLTLVTGLKPEAT